MNTKLKWLTQQEMKLEKEYEEHFLKYFMKGGWQSMEIGKDRRLGAGLYDLLKANKPNMVTVNLRYFSVFLKPHNIPASPMMSVVFDAATEYCRKKGYGDSFSMGELFGFKIDRTDVFRVVRFTVNGGDVGLNPHENVIRNWVERNYIVEVFFLEDFKSVMK